MSIAALLLAAEYLDRREREAEHGYASTLPHSRDFNRRQPKSKKSQGNLNRTTHNELEKNRRAHLRNCLEKLKEMVPLGPESSRHTTLGLLNKAKLFIKNLEEKEKKQEFQKEQLLRDQRYLRRRLEQLGAAIVIKKRRSISESSSLTSFSGSSPSESDDIDILGYNSNPSDTDDHNSIQSMNSDGGMTITTRRLSFIDDVTL
ncbi:LOW QUALITY PROTEIN: max dimerization protein 1-like [Limulus polyphemus]|uniref:LOW QUALITY PROTEIN: max dimerization protein 1-like n=1 Tax=Limulus polyphemus TaxID=6850 RepID=A0ABM1B1Y5_LIMPO|nr:LOW QUALITY PROTEIN: max dimerization protein 1-like [Limulus polyphemus]